MAGVTMPMGIWSDPEWTGLNTDEHRLLTALWSYSADKLTDGRIKARDVEQVALLNRIPEHPELIERLVCTEVMKAESRDCWTLVGFLDLNQTKTQVDEARRSNRERVRAWREKHSQGRGRGAKK